MKKLLCIPLIIGFISTGFALPQPQATQTQSINGIAAVVNSDIITNVDLATAMTAVKARISGQQAMVPPTSVLRKQVLNMLIMQKLQLQMAKRAKLTISQDELTSGAQRIAKLHNLSLDKFKAEFCQQQGVPLSQFDTEFKKQLLISKIQRMAVLGKVHVSPTSVNAAYQKALTQQGDQTQYELGDILIALPNKPTSNNVHAALIKANGIVEKLKKGANFAALARSTSDAQNALSGGSLGYRTLNQLPSLFATQAKTMKLGEVRGPLRAGNGFHVIQLENKRSNGNGQPITKAQVQNMLVQKAFMTELQKWMQSLKSSSYIKIIGN